MINRKPILDQVACEAAATSMGLQVTGLDDVKAFALSWTRTAPGCIYHYNLIWGTRDLYYNTLSTSTTSCTTDYSDFCLCVLVPDCTHTNGATSNTDACLCGGTECTAASGLFCTASTNTCRPYAPCTVGDGSTVNSDSCTCGTNDCTAATGLFCEQNTCSPYASCTVGDGSSANSDSCACGTNDCTAATGLFCQKDINLCFIPDCLTTDGSVANNVACTCGGTECTPASGLFCYAEASQCSTTTFSDLCPIRDGSAANTVACTCGSVECTSDTGLICYSTYGGGSCRKTGFGPFGYSLVESGTCDSMNNRKPLLDKAACEAAATSMGLDDVVAYEFPSTSSPPGCFWHDNRLLYNLVDLGRTCTSIRACLCFAAQACTHTNGATSNTDACLCGETGFCTADSGLYCTSSTNTCSSGDLCTSVDGSSLNTIDCSCGTAVCNSFNGMYCHASLNLCSTVSVCAVTDGSVANPGRCKCGNVACTESTGLICYSTYGGGSCRKTGFGPFGYPKEEGTNCGSVSNRKPILDKAACEAAATSMGLVASVDDVGFDLGPLGCYVEGGSLKFKNNGPVGGPCTSVDFCLCVAASDYCTQINGTTSNTDACLCGGTGCTPDSGLFCTASTNTCSPYASCTVGDGSTVNSDSCACGTNDCTAATGLFCEQNTCSPYASCTVGDSSSANSDSCACGTNDCTAVTGLFCQKDINLCFMTPGPYTVVEKLWYSSCDNLPNRDVNNVNCTCDRNVCNSNTGIYCYDVNGEKLCGEKEILIAVAHVGTDNCMSISPELQFWINMDPKAHIVTKLIPSGKMTFTDLAVSDNTVLGTTFNRVVVSGTLDVTHMTTNQLNIDYDGELSDVAELLKTIQDSINTL